MLTVKTGPELLELCESLRIWFQERNYRGIDPFLLDERFFGKGFFRRGFRKWLKPLHAHVPSWAFGSLSPLVIPKALGLLISGNAFLYRIEPKRDYLQENRKLIDLLRAARSPLARHFAWGWPFAWGQDPRYARNFPLVCVTAPIGLFLLDHVEASGDPTPLEIAREIAAFLLEENGFKEVGQTLCFYYSRADRFLVHNANLFAAAFFARLFSHTKEEKFLEIARRALHFSLDRQREEGSWPYGERLPGGRGETVDHRHTSFVLEALFSIQKVLQDDRAGEAMEKGWRYYRENFFEGPVPKWSPPITYPCDIHDVAQAIVTVSRYGEILFAQEIVQFALHRFFDGKDQFYYKLFADGTVNRTVFFRWNQAWMFKALSFFASEKEGSS